MNESHEINIRHELPTWNADDTFVEGKKVTLVHVRGETDRDLVEINIEGKVAYVNAYEFFWAARNLVYPFMKGGYKFSGM